MNRRVVLSVITPEMLIAPAGTSSPTVISLGKLSPVRADVSIDVLPLSTMPSSGIFSPGFTLIILSVSTFSGSTVIYSPSIRTSAVSGFVLIREDMLLLDLFTAIDWKNSPTV